MIDFFRNILITTTISLIVIYSFSKYSEKDNTAQEIIVFSAKDIIEHKKLQIKKAILNNEDIEKKENELEVLIKNIDQILEEISKTYNKPIYQKEMILKGNNIIDITPMIEKTLEKKGLLWLAQNSTWKFLFS